MRSAVDSETACFGTVDSWLIYQMTGGTTNNVHITDGAMQYTLLLAVDFYTTRLCQIRGVSYASSKYAVDI